MKPDGPVAPISNVSRISKQKIARSTARIPKISYVVALVSRGNTVLYQGLHLLAKTLTIFACKSIYYLPLAANSKANRKKMKIVNLNLDKKNSDRLLFLNYVISKQSKNILDFNAVEISMARGKGRKLRQSLKLFVIYH